MDVPTAAMMAYLLVEKSAFGMVLMKVFDMAERLDYDVVGN